MNQNNRKLKICFTSDVHGYFYPTTYADKEVKNVGLFGCADSFFKDENTLLIDGGDILQGSAFTYYCKQELDSPEAIAGIMSEIGYDYFTLGNHDYNYGTEYQAKYTAAHKGKCLCQNVTDEAGNILFPYDVKVMTDGLRVGLVGIVTDYINVWEKKENLQGVIISDPFAAAKKALEELKEKTDLTVCIYHGGFECDLKTGERLSQTTENAAYRICQELNFDILLTGHQHMSVDGQYINNTYVVQPLDRALEYHYIEVEVSGEGKKIRSEKRSSNGNYKASSVSDHYQNLQDKVQDWLDLPIGHLSRPLLPGEKAEMALHGSPIADFINRIQLFFSEAQISVVGLANEIAGFRENVSMRDIIATYPYPNTLVVCQINGRQLRTVMERSAEYLTMTEDGTVVVSESFLVPKVEHYNYDYYLGVEYQIDPSREMGERVRNLTYQGKPVTDQDSFTICLNNYRVTGAGGYETYQQCPVVREINIEMAELIMDYFIRHKNIEV